MSYASFLADPFAIRNRGEVWIEFRITDPNGDPVTLRYSLRGTPSDPFGATILVPPDDLGTYIIPANTPYDMRLIEEPSFKQAIWNGSEIGGPVLPSYGDVTLRNGDLGLNSYHPDFGYTWETGEWRMFFFDSDPAKPQSDTIGIVGVGLIGTVEFGLDFVTVHLLGHESTFDQRLSDRVYRGSSYLLELNGTKKVDFGTPAATDLNGDMNIELWVRFDALPSGAIRFWGYEFTAPGSHVPWGLLVDNTGTLKFAYSSGGGTGHTVTFGATTLDAKKWYHVNVQTTSNDLRFLVWDDAAQHLYSETQVSALVARDLRAVGNLVFQSLLSARMWGDELRVWNNNRTDEEVAQDRYRSFLAASAPAALVHYVPMDDGGVSATATDLIAAANGTISGAGSHLWLWGCEGDFSLAGKPKPDGWGDMFGCSVVPVGTQWDIYQWLGGGEVEEFTAIREGGEPITLSTDYPDLRDFIIAAMDTGAGTAVPGGSAITSKANGMFKLGRHPEKPVSVDGKGYNGGPLGYVETAADIIRTIAQTRGTLQDAAYLDTDSMTQLNTDAPYVLGVFVADPASRNIDDLFSQIMKSVGLGTWGYGRGSNKLSLEVYRGPGVSSDFDFTQDNVVLGTLKELNVKKTQIYRVDFYYRPNAVPLSDTDVAAALIGVDVADPTLGSITAATFRDPELVTQKYDKATRDSLPGDASSVYPIHSFIRYDADANTVAQIVLNVMKGRHFGWTSTFTHPAKEMEAASNATLSFVQPLSGRTFVNLDGSNIYSVLSLEDRRATGVVEVVLWR